MAAKAAVASDEELMSRVQADDAIAFEELLDRYSAKAHGLAHLICRDSVRAEDAVQEGFIAIWRARATYDPARGSARAWMLTLVRHRSIDLMRQGGRGNWLWESDEWLDGIPAPACVAEQVERQDEGDRLRASLRELPVLQREVIVLAYFGGLTHTEIAERLRLPPGTVKGRMRLGLHKLRAEINPPQPQASAGDPSPVIREAVASPKPRATRRSSP